MPRPTSAFTPSLFLLLVLPSILYYRPVLCHEHDAESPTFVTKSQTLRVIIGETAILPCQVRDLGDYVIIWKRGNSVLSAGDMKIARDARISLVNGFDLEIKSVRPSDGGDFVCQISTPPPEEELLISLQVLVPPTIRSETNHLTVSRGDTVRLSCSASGNPTPTVVWTRKNNALPMGEEYREGNSYVIEKADRHTAGIFECSANNGVGNPIKTEISVTVEYPPEIDVEGSWIHSGEGQEATLVCIVHSNPPTKGYIHMSGDRTGLHMTPGNQQDSPGFTFSFHTIISSQHKDDKNDGLKLKWYKGVMILDQDGRRLMETRGSRHSLIIRNVNPSDFGNYSCEADNKLGRSRKHIELSGRPNRPIFRSDTVGRSQVEVFNITWSVESYSPIEEYRLSYRRKNANNTHDLPGEWHDVVIPSTDNFYKSRIPEARKPFSPFHQRFYLIRGVEPNCLFEAKIVAKNKYGWSQPSDLFQFNTRASNSPSQNYPYESSPHQVLSDPEIRDMKITAATSSASTLQREVTGLLVISVIVVNFLRFLE